MRVTNYGLVLGDSILYSYFDEDKHLASDLESHFNLDSIQLKLEKGKTIDYLAHKVFPREIVRFNNFEQGEDFIVTVFLFAGAIDLADAITDNLDFDFDKYIFDRNHHISCILDCPHVFKLYVLPLLPRKLCKNDLKLDYPKYGVPKWISSANDAIKRINCCPYPFHPKLRIVKSSALRGIQNHVAKDGIHLQKEGKHIYARSVFKLKSKTVSEVVQQKPFSPEEFPPLPTGVEGKSPLHSLDPDLALKLSRQRSEKSKRIADKEDGFSFVPKKQKLVLIAGPINLSPATIKVKLPAESKASSLTVVKSAKKRKHKKRRAGM